MKQRVIWVIGAAAAGAVIAAAGAAAPPGGLSLTSVPHANTKSIGYAPPNVLSPELQEIAVAQGSTRVENPDPATISYYGYDNDKVNDQGQPLMVPVGGLAEAHKTEPDKNTYLVFKRGLKGADPSYDYGTHFLFQGHEGAASGFPGPITRINLDADAAHRVTDAGGAFKNGTTAKRPNSFIFRYVPKHPGDLANGTLQALQVLNDSGAPITFESQADLHAADQVALHTYGKAFKTRWVTVHDTAKDGTTPFSANTAAKAAHATPFKRPENGLFQPGSRFRTFFFDETGDTDAASPENDDAGGWGSVMKLTQRDLGATSGTLTMFYVSDGDTSVDGILGAEIPDLSDPSWRWFWTQQHGDNTTWEVTVSSGGHGHGGDGQGGDDQGDD
jgi:hypothetical protein